MATSAIDTTPLLTAGGRRLSYTSESFDGFTITQSTVALRPGETERAGIVYDHYGIPVDAACPPVPSEAAHEHAINRTLLHKLLEQAGDHDAAARWYNCRALRYKRTCIDDPTHTDDLDTWLPFTCELRCCPACANADSNRFADKYGAALAALQAQHGNRGGHGVSMVTLTTDLDFTAGNVAQQQRYLKMLHGWVRKFIYKLGWHNKPNGVVAAPEVGSEGLRWHVHMLAYIPYVDQKQLSALWASITGCPVVDVRRVRGRGSQGLEAAVRETLKYATKVSKGDTPRAARRGLALEEILVRMHLTLKGQRRVWSYGSLYRLGEQERDKELPCCPACAAALCLEHPDAYQARKDARLRDALDLILTNNFSEGGVKYGLEITQKRLLE